MIVSPYFLYVTGDSSGVGKSSICLALLQGLVSSGALKPSDCAYIKPCTQCEDISLVVKYCESVGIEHRALGPVIFYPGFTAKCIEEQERELREGIKEEESAAHKRRLAIAAAISSIGVGKRFVLIDGVGYPAVGSVCGVSNGQVAALLSCPVMVVGRPGLGNAIDAMNFILGYFNNFPACRVLGGVWNKLPQPDEKVDENSQGASSYHSYQECKSFITRYYKMIGNKFSVYGFLPTARLQAEAPVDLKAPEVAVACRLRAPKKDLEMTDNEKALVAALSRLSEENLAAQQVWSDVVNYWEEKRKAAERKS